MQSLEPTPHPESTNHRSPLTEEYLDHRSNLEELAIDAFHNFWATWSSRQEDTEVRALALIHDLFKGFGTNKDEYWAGKHDLLTQLRNELRQIPEVYLYETTLLETLPLGEDVVMVCAEMSFTFQVSKGTVVLDRVRNTFIFQRDGDQMLLNHWHCSVPDGGNSGEVIPGSTAPKKYEDTSVFFCDFVRFTSIVASVPATKLVTELNDIYQNFDDIMEHEHVEKIQVTGDGYLAVSGLNGHDPDHAIRCVLAAKRILAYLDKRNERSAIKWHARIGIHSGPLTAGIIGKRKFSLNVFGDTVNVASRLQTASKKSMINISAYTYDLIKDAFDCTYRGKIVVKGKGELDMYFVN